MKKFLILFFSFLILFGNTGLTYATHYCGGKAVKSLYSLFYTNLSCGMQEDKCEIEISFDKDTISKAACCQNKLLRLTLENQITDEIALQEVDGYQQFNFIHLLPTTIDLFIPKYINEFRDYSPPVIILDIQVFVQSFLI